MTLSVGQLFADAARGLAAVRDPEEARREAQVLLGFALGVSRAWLTAHADDAVDPPAAHRFGDLVARRCAGEPIAYLVGLREFYGLEFRVTPAVLIPRPETELLVDAALERLPVDEVREVLDLGTGSGCVAIAIAHERPSARVAAVDRSTAALSVAADNSVRLRVAIELLESDWFANLGGRRFDAIVSNPPYIAAGDPHLAQGDLRFEPQTALAAGGEGLSDIRHIVVSAPNHLRDGGWLLFEHGYDQAPACRDLLRNAGFRELLELRDLAGLPRLSGGRLLTGKSPSR